MKSIIEEITRSAESPLEEKLGHAIVDAAPGPGFDLVPQHELVLEGEQYRLDFALFVGERRFDVECDGHDYHERTPAQASHDRRRDRALQRAGWMVLRYPGTDVHRDAAGCALDVWLAVGTDPALSKPRSEQEQRPVRVRLVLPGPSIDALSLLVAFPDLAPVAEEEGLAGVLPDSACLDFLRDLLRGPVALGQVEPIFRSVGGAAAVRRLSDWLGSCRPSAEVAERELRKAVLKARIQAFWAENDRLLAEVSRGHASGELASAVLAVRRGRVELEKRLRAIEVA